MKWFITGGAGFIGCNRGRYNYRAFSLFDTNVELDVTKFTNITNVVFQTIMNLIAIPGERT